MIMHYFRKKDCKLIDIANLFGFDHSTICHGLKKFADLMDVYEDIKEEYVILEFHLNQHN